MTGSTNPVTRSHRRQVYDHRPACCTEEEEEKGLPFPTADHATRTEFVHRRSSIRLMTWAAIATSVARAWSLWKRSPSPMTCFQRANWPSTRALSLQPLSRCQAIRPLLAIAWMWQSRWVGSVSAVALSTASDRGIDLAVRRKVDGDRNGNPPPAGEQALRQRRRLGWVNGYGHLAVSSEICSDSRFAKGWTIPIEKQRETSSAPLTAILPAARSPRPDQAGPQMHKVCTGVPAGCGNRGPTVPH